MSRRAYRAAYRAAFRSALVMSASLSALAGSAAAAPAQDRAAPPLPTHHWAYDALDRLADAGLLHGRWSVGHRPASQAEVAAALTHGAVMALARFSPLAAFAGEASATFAEEYPWAGAPLLGPVVGLMREAVGQRPGGRPVADPGEARWGVRGVIGARWLSSMDAAADDAGDDVIARPLPDTTALGAELELAITSRHLSAWGQPRATAGGGAGGLEAIRFGAAVRLGALQVMGGRERFHFGSAAAGGLAIGPAPAHDVLSAGTVRPVRLGRLSDVIGPVRTTLLATRTQNATGEEDAWLLAGRVDAAPHTRVRIGLNRMALAGPDADGAGPGGGDLLRLLTGGSNERGNAVLSADVRVRITPGKWVLVPFLEWGRLDSAEGWFEDPAIIAGVQLPYLPPASGITLRYDFTAFGDRARICRSCERGVTGWYLPGTPPGTGAMEAGGLPIGHPLGGYGHEHRAAATTWFAGVRGSVEVVAFERERLAGNLHEQAMPGRSRGGEVRFRYRTRDGLDLRAAALRETADRGWRLRRMEASVSFLF